MAKNKKEEPQPQYDAPWKGAIVRFFPDFMKFFFPVIYDAIDWKKKYEFLENDLQKITKDAELGRRHADKLVRVFKKTGEAAWVLIHVEVQSARESKFSERIYVYRHRIWEQHQVDVASLVILCDNEANYRPNTYEKELWGCELKFKFPIVKLLDFEKDWDKLEKSKNPFSLVAMAQLKSKLVKAKEERKYWKIQLIKMLFKRGYTAEDVQELFGFIDWILELPAEMESAFIQKVIELGKENDMRYVTSFERVVKKQGIQQGRQEGESLLLFRMLERKFGQIDDEVKQKVEAADSETLLEWGENLMSAPTIDAVFK